MPVPWNATDDATRRSPAAPSDAEFRGGVLSWSDNSENEDGFLICVDPGGFEFVVAADTTTFVPPPEPSNCPDSDNATYVTYAVYAFNAQGLSGPALRPPIIGDCAVPGPATPTASQAAATATPPPAVLPDTGGVGDSEANASAAVWALLAGGIAALLGAGALVLRRVRT